MSCIHRFTDTQLTELYSMSLSSTNACIQMHVAGSQMDAEKTMCKLEDPESNYELVDNLLYLLRHPDMPIIEQYQLI